MSVQSKAGRAAGAIRMQRTARRRLARMWVGVVAAVFVMVVPLAMPAQAVFDGTPAPGNPLPGPNVDVTLTDTGFGQSVEGGLPPVGTSFDPTAGYPADVPAGYEPDNPSFAGVIVTEDEAGNGQLMYCIDIRTSTNVGLGYARGSWEESNVPNIGYVDRVLNSYYPDQPGLPVAPDDNSRAAAVQAAIWFFSDGYVLSADDPVRSLVEQIVAEVLTAGPLTEPPPPEVDIAPPVAAGPVGGTSGPFTVTAGDGAVLTVTASEGSTLYTDAAGTVPVTNPVASGTQLWVRSDNQTADPAVIRARAVVPVDTGNVYLYAGNDPSISSAQKLILAADAEVDSSAEATAEFFVPGDLMVTKTFAGEAAGQQGAISLAIDCGAAGAFVVEIPAGTATAVSETITDLPVGTICTVTEPATGGTTAVSVAVALPEPIEIVEGENAVTVTNTVEYNPGSLLVAKTISGSGAGLQDDIVIRVQCDDATLDETIVLPAGTAAGEYTQLYEGIPAGVLCRVSEPTTGVNEEVAVETGVPDEVPVIAGQMQTVAITNTYAPVPYTKRLPKTGAEATTSLAVAGGGALLAGTLLVVGSTRRRHSN